MGGATAWVTTRPGSPKTRHLAAEPRASLLYWNPTHEVVMAECTATLEAAPSERERVWRAIAAEPEPYGFDPGPMFPAGPADPSFCLPRLEARRIELAGIPDPGAPAVWRRQPRRGAPAICPGPPAALRCRA